MEAGEKENQFSRKIGQKERLKLKAQNQNNGSVWMSLGMFGMVGWSVAVPALLGAALGIWLDKKYPESFSWTLTFLTTGLFAGCLIAWNWINKEHKAMNRNEEEENE